MSVYSAHIDTFARDNLPPRDQWPDLIFTLPELQYPERLNCIVELLDTHVREGDGDRPAIFGADGVLTYAQMQAQVDRVAHVLTHDMGLVPGNRVLLRSANNAMLAICWCAVAKAGLIVVATMPLLREKELVDIIEKVQISAAICDRRLDAELQASRRQVCIFIVISSQHVIVSRSQFFVWHQMTSALERPHWPLPLVLEHCLSSRCV